MAVKGVVFDVTSGKGKWLSFMNPYFWGTWQPEWALGMQRKGRRAGRVPFPQTELMIFVSVVLPQCFSNNVTLLLKDRLWLPAAYAIKFKLDDLL